MSRIETWNALALQTRCDAVNRLGDAETCREQMAAGIARIGAQIAASKAFIGPQVRLVVLPEYFLTGFPMGESIEAWRDKACIAVDGPEYAALGEICKAHNVFLSGNVYELDANFPELYFQASFIMSSEGEVILRYRRLVSMFAPTPHDVLDRYLECYGEDSLFPVADTELGRLACVASEEILFPEISRALALRGAEVICHSSSEVGSPQPTPKKIARQARAYENHCFIVSANSAGIEGTAVPAASTDGGSGVIDFHGHILAEASPGESMVGNADVDIEALRHYRRRPGMFNYLSRQRLELFSASYSGDAVYPANTLLGADGQAFVPERQHFVKTQAEVIERLRKRKLI